MLGKTVASALQDLQTLLTLSFLTWIVWTRLWLLLFKLIGKGFVQQVKANLLENPDVTVVYVFISVTANLTQGRYD